jgi:prophage antirepressor-like protein
MNSGQIQPFNFEGQEIRFVGTPEAPEWVAADVVAVLYPEADSRNYSNYLSKVTEEWKGHKNIMTLGGEQDMVTLYEPGLYALITRSSSSLAIPFQKWIFEEVLPSIRKTGSYYLQHQPSSNIPPDKERLENIRLGVDLMYELGGVDERTSLALKDMIRDILLAPTLQAPSLPSGGRAEWPVSDRARHLGYRPKRPDLLKIGKLSAQLYRLRYDGESPPEREQFVDGTTRMVKWYGENDLDILDQAIAMVMEPPAQLSPVKDDSSNNI